MIVYLCGSCKAVCRISSGILARMSMSYCTVCGFDYFHEDFEAADELYDHMWIDLGGEG